jgi:hypothetical protein
LEYLRAVLILSSALPAAADDLYSLALITGVWNNFSQIKADAAYALGKIDNEQRVVKNGTLLHNS